MLNKLLRILYYLSFAFLIYVLGALMLHFELPPANYIKNAAEGMNAWDEQANVSLYEQGEMQSAPTNEIDRKPTVMWNKQKALFGFTLIIDKSPKVIDLVDMRGRLVHRWNVDFKSIWPDPQHVKSNSMPVDVRAARAYPDGSLLIVLHGAGITPYGAGMVKLDINSKVIWTFDENAHHALYVDNNNGEIYGLSQHLINSAPEGYQELKIPALVDEVVRLNADGKLINKVSIIGALISSGYGMALFRDGDSSSRRWDWVHANSVMKLEPEIADKFPMFEAGQVLVSLREPGMLAVLDMNKETVVWAMHGPWRMQHDASFLPDGTIMLFDNQGHKNTKKQYSRILIIDPETGKTVWNFIGSEEKPFNTAYSGAAQHLNNKNILVSSSLQNNVFEITPSGEVVWDYQLAMTKLPYLRAYRYTPDEVPFLFDRPTRDRVSE
ncbi:MAG: arylsulfotransferase family protein [Alphaproteobacteria bacterium]